MLRRLGILALLLLWLAPAAGRADPCSAAATLAALHDAYLALGEPDRETRHRAAIALLALILPDANADAIADGLSDLDPPPDSARLIALLETAATAARDAVANDKAPSGPNRASGIDGLADMILRSGCTGAWGQGYLVPPPAGDIDPLIRSDDSARSGKLLILSITLATLIAVAAIRRSRPFRRHGLRAQPRMAVNLDASALLANGQCHPVKVLDLSLGGMKITLRDAPPPGAALTIDFGTRAFPASIAWRNDFYAGILFDTELTRRGLEEILALGPSRAGGRPARASR